MDTELTALVAAGATALVQRMASDGWDQVRGRVARFLAARRGTADGADAEGSEELRNLLDGLDGSREELIAARAAGDASAEEDLRAEWRNRLRRTLRADPALAGKLRALIDELTPRSAGGGIHTTYNTITGGVHHGTVIQAGRIDAVHQEPGQGPR